MHQGPARGADLQYNLELSLEQVVHGDEVDLKIPKLVFCDSCNGSRSQKGSLPKKCHVCNGQGEVRISQGFFSIQQPCSNCRGEGIIITDPCRSCKGRGRISKTSTETVNIPKGVATGNSLRLSGKGEASTDPNGKYGDLYVQIYVKDHATFRRRDDDLLCDLHI